MNKQKSRCAGSIIIQKTNEFTIFPSHQTQTDGKLFILSLRLLGRPQFCSFLLLAIFSLLLQADTPQGNSGCFYINKTPKFIIHLVQISGKYNLRYINCPKVTEVRDDLWKNNQNPAHVTQEQDHSSQNYSIWDFFCHSFKWLHFSKGLKKNLNKRILFW